MSAVAELRTTPGAPGLLAQLLRIEREGRRIRLRPGAPRTLDLDLLLYRDQRLHQPGLVVPHPRMQLRAFVLVPLLVPLLETAPEVAIPGRGTAAAWYPVVRSQLTDKLVHKNS
jgi:2-amino-4-hydroxy-6-hydroxymethyldihydropteridine diphosphokinase